MNGYPVNIPTREILKVLAVTATFIAVLYSVFITRGVLSWVVIAFALALALNPAVSWLTRKIPGRSRALATTLVFLAVVSAIALLAFTLVRPVAGQTEQLVSDLPIYTAELSKPGTWAGDLIIRYDLISRIQASQSELVSRLTNASGTFVGLVLGFFSSVVALISIFGLTFFMMLEGPAWIKMFWEVLPKHKRKHGKQLAEEMYQAMVGYVNGKILAAFLAGASAAIALAILHVPYAAPLALLVGLLSIIPIFGATIAAVIVVAVCIFTSPASAIIMAVFFFVYQQIENNIIQPYIFKRALDVSPLLVFVSVLIGTAVGGIVGALLAIPVTACVQILVRDFYSTRLEQEKVEKPA